MHSRLSEVTPRPENDLSARPNGRSGIGSAGVAHRGRLSISSLLTISLFLTSSPPATLSATPARDSGRPGDASRSPPIHARGEICPGRRSTSNIAGDDLEV